ncbi:hypothetical protein OBBRIDRAFT_715668, partial [Obba rivulosa]
PPLEADPNLALCPDYAAPEFQQLRNALIQARNGDENQAIQFLVEQWTAKNDADKERWAAQQLQRIQEEQPNVDAQGDAEDERREREDNSSGESGHGSDEDEDDFEFGVMVADDAPTTPCSFALDKLNKKQYVELWYFTQEGRREEQVAAERSVAEEAFAFVHGGKGVELRKASAISASSKVVKDEYLTWDQFFKANGVFLDLLPDAGWKKKTRDAFALFFYRLEKHPLREESFGESILLAYQARVRREWHRALAKGKAFDIGVFNDKRLSKIQSEVLNKKQAESIRAV